ncbi:MAG TPA: type II toxin-antitoxin system prevent-host-death family antitoxin [Casimicrobiaceae bacterium]|nr:type II toxin-antitoxin system prevent-host-death family antitoxin [Casimicrobiaceae bacterium]
MTRKSDCIIIASEDRKSRVKEVPLSEVKEDSSRYLREAESKEILITRLGKPAGVLIGFASEDDGLDYQMEKDRRFLERIIAARESYAVVSASHWRIWISIRANLMVNRTSTLRHMFQLDERRRSDPTSP